MSNNSPNFFSAVVDIGEYRSTRRLRNHTRFMLKDVSTVNRVLDIGGGSGVMSFYAASEGAEEVICLEPEMDGSTTRITEQFMRLQQRVPGGDRVRLIRQTIQDFDPGEHKFDLIMSFNAINHLDEDACIALQTDKNSYERYIAIFQKLFAMTAAGGRIIMSDCSRYNIFQLLRIVNPLMPSIEWHKHQSPYLWTSMMSEVGFVKPRIQWSSYHVLGWPGRLVMGNALVNYVTISHFKFTMYKP